MSATLNELSGQIDERRKKLAQAFEEAGPEYDMSKVKSLDGSDSQAKVEQIQALDKELTDLVKSYEDHPEKKLADAARRLKEMEKLNPHPGHQPDLIDESKGGPKLPTKSLGAKFAESAEVKAWRNGAPGQSISFFDEEAQMGRRGMKATLTTAGTEMAPLSIDDKPGIQLLGQQRLTIADLLAEGTTTRETLRYVVEETFTNAATVVAEGATKPEATWDLDILTDPVTKIAVLSRISDETFADFPMLRDYIDGRMRFMIALTEEGELLSGDGTGVHLIGIMNRTGLQTQPAASDPVPDAVYKAIVKIMTGPFVDPDGVVMHPLDWQDIQLLKTDDGIYIWGPPNAAVAQPRIWGLPVVVTTAITQNTALVGAFRIGGQVWRRTGIQVDSTNSNEDDFKKNLVMLRAEERAGLAVYLPSAFCKVTGI